MGKSGNLSASAKSDGLDFNAPSSRLFSTRQPAKKDEEKTEVEIAKSGERSERERERQRALKDSAKKFAWTAASMHAFRIESRPMHRLHKKYGPQTSEAAARQASLTQPKPSYRNIPLCALSRRQRLVRSSTPLQVPPTINIINQMSHRGSSYCIGRMASEKEKKCSSGEIGGRVNGAARKRRPTNFKLNHRQRASRRQRFLPVFFSFLVAHPPHLNPVCAPLHEKVSVSWQKCSDFFFFLVWTADSLVLPCAPTHVRKKVVRASRHRFAFVPLAIAASQGLACRNTAWATRTAHTDTVITNADTGYSVAPISECTGQPKAGLAFQMHPALAHALCRRLA